MQESHPNASKENIPRHNAGSIQAASCFSLRLDMARQAFGQAGSMLRTQAGNPPEL